jgi:hypothetical protein
MTVEEIRQAVELAELGIDPWPEDDTELREE